MTGRGTAEGCYFGCVRGVGAIAIDESRLYLTTLARVWLGSRERNQNKAITVPLYH